MPSSKLILASFLYDIDIKRNRKDKINAFIKRITFHYYLNIYAGIVVHTNCERELYAAAFDIPIDKFWFIKYYHYATSPIVEATDNSKYIIVAGNHRDLVTFLEALKLNPLPAVIVGSEVDRELIEKYHLEHLRSYFNISYEQYHELIINANILVIPIHSEMKRSIGQIAVLKAAIHRIPIVAPDTWHLRDYLPDESALLYEANNPLDLSNKIILLMKNSDLKRRLSEHAYKNVIANHSSLTFYNTLLDRISLLE